MAKFKISIRTNILTLFAALMLTIGITVVAIHYYTSSRLLFQEAEDLLRVYSQNIEYEVEEFLQPAKHRVTLGAKLIRDGLIKLDRSPQFTAFLLANIIDLPRFSAAYFGDVDGGMAIVQRGQHDFFISETVVA